MKERPGFTILEGFEEFHAIQPQFLVLFQRVFGRPYPVELWEHYYKDNPCGPPLGIALWDGDILVGFSALLTQELVHRDTGELIPYGYNVTAMIDPDHRKGGSAYLQIMRQLRQSAEKAGFRVIVGFPNDNNFLPMTRLANFKFIDSARFVRSRGNLGRYREFLAQETKKFFFSDRLWSWRLSRFSYQVEQGCVTKVFKGEKNILDWIEMNGDEEISGIFPFWSGFGECPFEPVDSRVFRFCCLPLDPSFNPQKLKRSLLYSDVF